MRIHRVKFAVLFVHIFLLFLLLPGSFTASAAETKPELFSQMEESLNVSIFYEENTYRLIQSFDVNSDGWYAISFNDETIRVYDSLGEFQYGYSFELDGDYGIKLLESNIVIYPSRGGYAIEIDPSGECVDVRRFNFSDTTDTVLHRTCKQVGDVNYYVEHDIGIMDRDYPRLVRIDESGNRTILYESKTWGYVIGVLHYMVLAYFPLGGILAIIQKFRQEKREAAQNDEQNSSQTDN